MTALYTAHHRALFGFVRHYTPDSQGAEDVVQETLLRAWRHIDALDTRSDTVRSYLFTTARNVLTDMWRAEQRRPRFTADDEALNSIPSLDDVEAALDGQLVAAAMERLSPEHQSVVHALYYQGLSVADAAARLTIPEGTVKSRAYYAVRNLRAALEEMGVLR